MVRTQSSAAPQLTPYLLRPNISTLLNCDPLNANEIKLIGLIILSFKSKLNCFLYSAHEFIKRPCLCVSACKSWHTRNVKTLWVSLNNHIELFCHGRHLWHFSIFPSSLPNHHRRIAAHHSAEADGGEVAWPGGAGQPAGGVRVRLSC